MDILEKAIGKEKSPFEKVFANYGCKIITIDEKKEISNMDELANDMVSPLASFAGKLYGRRSAKKT